MHFIRYDSPFGRVMSRLVDIVVLCFLGIMCCLPVITAGASFAGLYYVFLKTARREEGNVVKQFFKGFKDNFGKATVLWLIMLAAGVIFYIDIALLNQVAMNYADLERIVLLIIAAVGVMVASYFIPLQVQFENTVGGTIKNAFLLSVMNFPRSLLLLLIKAAPYFIILFIPETVYFLPILCVALLPYFESQIFVRIFEKYMPQGEEEAESESKGRKKEQFYAPAGDIAAFGQLSEDEIPESPVAELPEDEPQEA